MREERVSIPLSELSDRQLLLHLHKRLDDFMADLNQSISDLQGAVDGVAQRVDAQVTPLTQALEQAQSALDAMTVQDEADKAALAEALNNAQAAASEIENQVSELNNIATGGPGPDGDGTTPDDGTGDTTGTGDSTTGDGTTTDPTTEPTA